MSRGEVKEVKGNGEFYLLPSSWRRESDAPGSFSPGSGLGRACGEEGAGIGKTSKKWVWACMCGKQWLGGERSSKAHSVRLVQKALGSGGAGAIGSAQGELESEPRLEPKVEGEERDGRDATSLTDQHWYVRLSKIMVFVERMEK